MLVQIRDRNAVSSIPIMNVLSYLNSHGWHDAGAWGSRPATIYTKEHGGRTWEILAPTKDTIADYAESMAESVAILATVEDRSQLDVFHDLMGAGSDMIRVRSANGAAMKALSLRQSASLLNDSYDLLASAARAVEDPRATYRGKLSADVAEYLDSVRPLPGYYEGYALTLHSPVPAGFGRQEDFGDDFYAPFPRRATLNLAKSLKHSRAAIDDAITSNSLDAFEKAIPSGVSANLCNSVAELAKKGNGVEIGLFWADVRPSNAPDAHFSFSANSADVLMEAARVFRRDEPSFDERIVAQVVRLDREPHEFDGRATLLAARDERPTRIRVKFDHSDYDTVIRAFGEHKSISVDGDVHRVGNGYVLRNPRNLSLVMEGTE